MNDQAQRTIQEVGEAVDHLSDYFKHLTTISAGAIAFLATFAGDLLKAKAAAGFAVGALVALGLCILASTGMMWAYGVARRQAASDALSSSVAAWAFEAPGRSESLAKAIVQIGPLLAPLSFVAGFTLLAGYAIALLSQPVA